MGHGVGTRTPAGLVGERQRHLAEAGFWAALRWALRHVPDGAEVAIRADRASIPLVRALLPLMLGDEPRVAARVDADDAAA